MPATRAVCPRSRRVLLILVLLLAAVSTAEAATVQVGGSPSGAGGSPLLEAPLRFTAAPGERNDVVLSSDGALTTVTDRGAPLHVGAGCEAIDDHTARCRSGMPFVAEVLLGDGDDRAVGDGGLPEARIDGGAGNDELRLLDGVIGGTLAGGDGEDLLVAGGHSAFLDGGAGADDLRGGPGDDRLTGGAGRDRLDGGAGSDMASWADDPRPVVVDLRTTSGGTVGEPDTLVGIENVTGGAAADLLTGDDGPNQLHANGNEPERASAGDRIAGLGGSDLLVGAEGDDVLDGGPGDDELEGSTGTDRLRGGAGDDSLAVNGASGDLSGGPGDDAIEILNVEHSRGGTLAVACGPGVDRLSTETFTEVRGGCEVAMIEDYRISSPRQTADGRVRVTVVQRPSPGASRCVQLRLTSAGRTLATRGMTRYPATVVTRDRVSPKGSVTVRFRSVDCRRRTLGPPLLAVRFRLGSPG